MNHIYIYIILFISLNMNVLAFDRDNLKQEIKEYQNSEEKLLGWSPQRFAIEKGYNEMALLYAQESYDPEAVFHIIDKRNHSLFKLFLKMHPNASNEYIYAKIKEPFKFYGRIYDVGYKGFENRSVLIYAIEEIESDECLDFVKILVENGADVNKIIKYDILDKIDNIYVYYVINITPLGAALYFEKFDVINYLIRNNVNSIQQQYFDKKNHNRQGFPNVLEFTIEENKLDVAEFLIQNLIKNTYELTNYIHVAIKYNNYSAAVLLINNGAKPSVSHIQYAVELGFYDIADLLSDVILTY